MIKLNNSEHTYLGVIDHKNGNCFVGYGAIQGDVKSGLKIRTSSKEFKTFRMWKIPAPASPFAVTYHLANLSSVIENIKRSKGEEILDD